MNVSIHPSTEAANVAAATLLWQWLTSPGVSNVMLAGGNTPLELYRLVAARNSRLPQLKIFALDEYVGVPPDEPRNCANLIRRTAVEPWGVPASRYYCVSSAEHEAPDSIRKHENLIEEAGGLDVIVLGLGQNGHLGFNEPGSDEDSGARVTGLDAISIEANRRWFDGDYAPARGATIGMKTILAARRVLLMATGAHKAAAVAASFEGTRSVQCPGSLLQGHPRLHVFLDVSAAAMLRN